MKIRNKTLLFIMGMLLFFTASSVHSQSYTQNNPNPELEEMAKEKTDVWIKELSLSGKQAALMEKKIVEFALKRDELIQSKMREEAKTERLKALQELMYKDMRDILTGPQFERYLVLKQERIDQQSQENKK